MAIFKDGIFGKMNGKVGNTVYYTLKGKQVTRIIGRRVKPSTPRQLANEQGMKVVNRFLKSINAFIKMGFAVEAEARNVYPYNAALGYNKKHALKGDFPEIGIDYEKVLLSKGDLDGLNNPSVRLLGNPEEGFALRFDWDVLPEDRGWPRCDDQVMLMAYFPEEGLDDRAVYRIAGAKRQAGQDVLELPLSMAGEAMEVYISVISEDRTRVADSEYLKSFQI